ncbi:hypothetical protein CRE_05657 [Caenorhabditis remanei]|uniref:BTB domain-containing protein n=1 Tax=Caenorhabditis remanei TaxID=31234 RepID=E3M0L0_CAERE|nr:hypothetical protein CRE_05657 [Caenorhabditis remanei]
MNENSSKERPKQSVVGRVSLKELVYGGKKLYAIGGIKWAVSIGPSTSHDYNQIEVSTMGLKEGECCHVELEVFAPKYLPNRMTFWHVFDDERHAFGIPYASKEKAECDWEDHPPEGKLVKGKVKGPYIRISLNPKIWRYRNWQFPFADLVLKVRDEELYVNRKILCSVSRFFVHIMESGRLECMNNHQVLYVKGVSFEDLYDLMGIVYHGWMFYSEELLVLMEIVHTFLVDRAMHLQSIAEQFGVLMDTNNLESFEGKISSELFSVDLIQDFDDDSSVIVNKSSPVRLGNVSENSSVFMADVSENQEEDFIWHVSFLSRFRCFRKQQLIQSLQHLSHYGLPQSPNTLRFTRIGPSISRPDVLNYHQTPNPIEDDGDDEEDDVEPEIQNIVQDDNMGMMPGHPIIKDSAPPTFLDCETLDTENNGMYFVFGLEFDCNYSEKFLRGGKYAIQTHYGNWDIYLYQATLNSNEYLSLGIYGSRFKQDIVYDTSFRIQVGGGSLLPKRKFIEKLMDLRRNTLGYPDFMDWSDVRNYANSLGMVSISVHLSIVPTEKFLPDLTYDQFPGHKDTFVEIEGLTFPVSRDVLSEASSVFQEMFNNSLLVFRRKVYQIHGISYAIFMLLMEYIYNKKAFYCLENVDFEELMTQAQRFNLKSVVQQLCRDYVDRDDINEREAYAFSLKFGLKTLMSKYHSVRSRTVSDHDNPITLKSLSTSYML